MQIDVEAHQIVKGLTFSELKDLQWAVKSRMEFVKNCPLLPEELEVAKKSMIEAIKLVRARTTLKLFDAKLAVEAALNGSASVAEPKKVTVLFDRSELSRFILVPGMTPDEAIRETGVVMGEKGEGWDAIEADLWFEMPEKDREHVLKNSKSYWNSES